MHRTIAALRDENARLKGGSGRPDIKPNAKPSGMEQATEPKPPEGAAKRRRGSTRDKRVIHEERIIPVGAPPLGSRLKGATSYVVQDPVIRPMWWSSAASAGRRRTGRSSRRRFRPASMAISVPNCAASC
jgi:hypothetical protein